MIPIYGLDGRYSEFGIYFEMKINCKAQKGFSKVRISQFFFYFFLQEFNYYFLNNENFQNILMKKKIALDFPVSHCIIIPKFKLNLSTLESNYYLKNNKYLASSSFI